MVRWGRWAMRDSYGGSSRKMRIIGGCMGGSLRCGVRRARFLWRRPYGGLFAGGRGGWGGLSQNKTLRQMAGRIQRACKGPGGGDFQKEKTKAGPPFASISIDTESERPRLARGSR